MRIYLTIIITIKTNIYCISLRSFKLYNWRTCRSWAGPAGCRKSRKWSPENRFRGKSFQHKFNTGPGQIPAGTGRRNRRFAFCSRKLFKASGHRPRRRPVQSKPEILQALCLCWTGNERKRTYHGTAKFQRNGQPLGLGKAAGKGKLTYQLPESSAWTLFFSAFSRKLLARLYLQPQ